jgi:hypothetical protein
VEANHYCSHLNEVKSYEYIKRQTRLTDGLQMYDSVSSTTVPNRMPASSALNT